MTTLDWIVMIATMIAIPGFGLWRGGRGKTATAVKDEDFVEKLFVAHTHDTVLCFPTAARCTGSRSTNCRRPGAGRAASR